jgi:hypothetical protein
LGFCLSGYPQADHSNAIDSIIATLPVGVPG